MADLRLLSSRDNIIDEAKTDINSSRYLSPPSAESIKTMRTIEEIDEYLRYCVPPYLNYTSLLSAVAFVIVPLAINVTFIILNMYATHSERTLSQYLQKSEDIIVWFEFISLITIFGFAILISLCSQSITPFINGVLYLKSWSAFKLFYAFRPQAIFEHLTIAYHHRSEGEHVSSTKLSKMQYISNQLNDTDDIDESDADDITTEFDEYVGQYTDNLKAHKSWWPEGRMSDNCFQDSFHNVSLITTWLLMLIIYTLLLLMGIISLILKISQFSFLNDKHPLSFSMYQIYFLIAFCNQLWNMTNEHQIRIDMMFNCLLMDAIKCKYTRYIAEHKSYLDGIIKKNLCKYHGYKGLLLSLQLDWKFIFKLVFKDSMDILCVNDTQTYQHILRQLHELKIHQKHSSTIKKMCCCCFKIKNCLVNLNWKLALKSLWKSLHPYTHAKYMLFQNKRQQQKLNRIWLLHPLAIFEWIRTLSNYLIPFVNIISIILGLYVLIWKREEIKYVDSKLNCWYSMFGAIIANEIFSILFVLSMLLIYKKYNKIKDDDDKFFTASGFAGFIFLGQFILLVSMCTDSCWYSLSMPIMINVYVISVSAYFFGLLFVVVVLIIMWLDVIIVILIGGVLLC
eukprot:319699_1